MDIKKLISNALEERFKASCAIKELEGIIRDMAKEKTFEKYQFHKIIRNEMEFELFGVIIHYDTWNYKYEKVSINLIYTVCSKLPKDKSERLQLFKERYNKTGWAEDCNFKIPIWEELEYDVELENILNDTINLRVD